MRLGDHIRCEWQEDMEMFVIQMTGLHYNRLLEVRVMGSLLYPMSPEVNVNTSANPFTSMPKGVTMSIMNSPMIEDPVII